MKRLKPSLPPPTVEDLLIPQGRYSDAAAPSSEALPFTPAVASCGDAQATIIGTLFDLAHQGDRAAAEWLAHKYNGTASLYTLYLHQNGAKRGVRPIVTLGFPDTSVRSRSRRSEALALLQAAEVASVFGA